MDTQKPAVPRIAISLEEDAQESSVNGYPSLAEALTDIEDMDSDAEQANTCSDIKKKSGLLFAGVGGDGILLTDTEDVDGSDSDEDYPQRPVTPLDNLPGFVGTFEELLQVTSDYKASMHGSDMSKVTTKHSTGGYLGLVDDSKDGITDLEDFALSDGEWIEEELELESDVDLDDHIPELGQVDVADSMKRNEATPSPSVTPEPGYVRKSEQSSFTADVFAKTKQPKGKKGKGNRKSVQVKKKKSQFLSPKPEKAQANDVTDTEILGSDSEDEEGDAKKTVRKHRKLRGAEGGVTDVEDLDMSGDEGYHFKDVDKIPGLPKVTRSTIHISDQPLPAPAFLGPDLDTDNEDMNLSDREDQKPVPHRRCQYKPKKPATGAGLLVPESINDALTDVEDMDGDDDVSDDDFVDRPPSPLVLPLEEMETHYGSVTVSYSTKKRERDPDAIDSDHGITDHEDFAADDKDDPLTAQKRRRSVMKYLKKKNRQSSTDEDDVEGSEGDFRRGDRGDNARVQQDSFEIRFMEVEGEARPIIVAPGGKIPIRNSTKEKKFLEVLATEGGLTDVEEVDKSSESSDNDEEPEVDKRFLNIEAPRRGSVTDVEDFEDDAEDKMSDVSDEGLEHVLPEAVREMTFVRYEKDGRPVAVTLPLSDDHRTGLMPMRDDLAHALTDVEDFTDDQDNAVEDEIERPPTPEIQMDFGIIDASEAMKFERKLRVQSVSHAPLTDTEDVYLEGGPNRRRKTKTKAKHLSVKPVEVRSGGTDVEELDVSDAEALVADGIALVQRPVLLIPASGNADGATDVENISGDDEDDPPRRNRPMSVTPDIMKNMDYSTTTFKEGSGPFPRDARRTALDPNRIVPTIRMTSPTPDLNRELTDTEDMQSSADDDPPGSRSEAATPAMDEYATTVFVKHCRKLDYEAAAEAMHMKGGDLREAHTDVEDLISEDEHRVDDRISVEETAETVCVCVGNATHADGVCVCVKKRNGALTMVWRNGDATTSATVAAENGTRGEEWTEKSQEKESAQSGAEGLIPQGATGGVSVTTTETRVVEGSDEMKEILEKLAAESRK